MAISIKHKFQSPKEDGDDEDLVKPSDWNDEHVLTLGQDKLLGRASPGTGPVEEIPCTAAGRALIAAPDAASQRDLLGITQGGSSTPPDTQTFNSSGTWVKPQDAKWVVVKVWGGGGGGARSSPGENNYATGGAGGGFVYAVIPADILGDTESVIVGAGGEGQSGSNGPGAPGGFSSFGDHLVVDGGDSGEFDDGEDNDGPKDMLPPSYGGLTGGWSPSTPYPPGWYSVDFSTIQALWAPGGGGSWVDNGDGPVFDVGQSSTYGGDGGDASDTDKGEDGSAPGGGGGAGCGVDGGDGAPGRVVVTTYF